MTCYFQNKVTAETKFHTVAFAFIISIIIIFSLLLKKSSAYLLKLRMRYPSSSKLFGGRVRLIRITNSLAKRGVWRGMSLSSGYPSFLLKRVPLRRVLHIQMEMEISRIV